MAWTNWAKDLRSVAKWTLFSLAVLFVLYLLHQCLLPLVAFIFPALDPALFDLGVFGTYPVERYNSFRLAGPQARHPRWDQECDEGLILLTPNGGAVESPGPMIVDSMGGLVWTEDDYGNSANLKVQRYKGEDYLTMWSGKKEASSGKGLYFMFDSSYQVVKAVKAAGDNLFGDLHEFKITPQDTALLTVYNTTNADLTGLGMGRGVDGWITDTMFQEIDLETGDLIFQWRASDHFHPADTYMTNPLGGYWESIPFDYYHLNSVDKDSKGNYIISSRHFHHVVCVSPTGETLWILGGRDNQFEDLSDGQATNFKWQHDARWLSEEDGIISLFDNSKAGPLHADASASRALLIQIDVPNRTAKLVQSLVSLQGILASSQGSVQLLPDTEQLFVGWGSAAAYSEYSRDGTLMCETHLAASWLFWNEPLKSYRATKSFTWVGMPKNPPQVKVKDDFLYVSWNGATEVAYWALEEPRGQHSEDADASLNAAEEIRDEPESEDAFEMTDIIPKTGFEGSFEISSAVSGKLAKYRVAALDSEHKVLRYSDVVEYSFQDHESSTLMVLFKLFLVVGFLAGARLFFRYSRSAGYLKRFGLGQQSDPTLPAWYDWTPASSQRSIGRPKAIEWIQMQWTAVTSRPR